tara:strand:+ start:101999 stop:103441 length:1443 start_codon:yes stop_codon:yes gene_type:complete
MDYNTEHEEGGSFLSHIPAMIRQRKLLLILPIILTLIIAIAAAFLLPVKYQSRAVLLVESPIVADALPSAPSADLVDQRMAKIRQQLLSRPELIEIIRSNNLYVDDLKSNSLTDVIEEMRQNIGINAVNADIQQAGRGTRSTIAFAVDFHYDEPVKAQAVAQALTERVLQLDSSKVSEQATNTVDFLTDQANGLQQQISELQNQISDIKARNGSILSNSLMPMIGSTGSYDAQIAGLRRENAMLNNQRDMTKTAANRDPVVAAAEQQLAAARASYSDSHPDVILAKQRLAEARKLAASNQAKIPVSAIDQQIADNNAQIAILQSAKAQESARISSTLTAQARAPAVNEQISQLDQRLSQLQDQYRTVSDKLLNARAGKKAEDSDQGERLSVIDPPVVPDDPSSPNRPVLIAGGLVGGLGLGIALLFAMELILRPIRDVSGVARLLGEPPLVSIPTIGRTDNSDPWYKRLKWPFRRKDSLQ